MTFAFYLGAGNIIFPPLAGFMAGEHLMPAMVGFLLTAVGLPLLTLVAVARGSAGQGSSGWTAMTRYLPTWAATALAIAIYIIMGPAFATPRTGLVAYEMGLKPWLGEAGLHGLLLYSLCFFALVILVSLDRGRLLDAVGKYLTPALMVMLLILALGVVIAPQGGMPEASGDYIDTPLIKGMLEGYNTMDTLASLMFGALIIGLLRQKGIEDYRSQFKYLAIAGLVSAVGLSAVYISLFHLGNSAEGVVSDISNGGTIVNAYVLSLFGQPGQFILAAIITLACFTSAVGLLCAGADYFHGLAGWTYRKWVLLMGCVSILVANVGLSQLISLSIPVLVAIYPVAIALVLVTFVQGYFGRPRLAFRAVLLVAFLFGCLDGLGSAGMQMDTFAFLPLFDKGLAWLLPTLLTCGFGMLLRHREALAAEAA
ncbi:branched-chain amino acid transport system II carrier protein [Aeromonas hydrophila]|uniref:branched-chain amino acid transport system II carrier protein n=1 Tax=Aeromonas hydrophila TaxID=644 RepID=UPI002366B5CA|nr:branched-chain amino acid transport system II carrier protein [Aeromonas hydrophila]WDF92752.1 branched-chain amino acid transport system II carrier protein [Aeromonas hydrophila subsp. hydrophila]